MRGSAKIFCTVVVLLLFCGGCTEETGMNPNPGKADAGGDDLITVAVTIPPQKEFAERIGGARVRVVVLVPPGASPHTYEPTSARLQEISDAAIYAKVGSGVEAEEAWMTKIAALNPDMKVVNCSEGIDFIMTDDGKTPDPHVWLSPENAGIMATHIESGLSLVDPEHEGGYAAGLSDYQDELEALSGRIHASLEGKEGMKIMVYHPAWAYFAREFGLVQIPVEEDGKDPSPRGLERLITQARNDNIRVIFASPEYPSRSAEVVAGEIGGRVVFVSPLAEDYLVNIEEAARAFSEEGGVN